jgi:hypothetical protein
LGVAGRPALSTDLSSAEFQRWYWLKAELVDFARPFGISATGSKPELANRIAAWLDGRSPQTSARRTTVSRRISEPLTRETVVGPHQAASQQLRPFFESQIGTSFSYDIHMRTFLASATSKTLGDAVDHWYKTRRALKPETLPQLEFVRFSKRWYRDNPAGTPSQCRAAWKHERSLPAEQRTLAPFRLD